MAVIVTDSLLEVKDSIIEALKAENLKLQQKVEKLENRISELEPDLNKKDQYNWRNNIEIQGIFCLIYMFFIFIFYFFFVKTTSIIKNKKTSCSKKSDLKVRPFLKTQRKSSKKMLFAET